MKENLLIFFYNKQNRYSINSLLCSLQSSQELLDLVDIKLAYTEEEIFSTVEEKSKIYNKLIIGISFTTIQFLSIKSLVEKIKKDKKITLICGGPHPTGSFETAINLGFDIAVLHEAENVFPELVKKIIRSEEYFNINNLAYIRDKEFIKTQIKLYDVDLNKYPAVPYYFNRYGPIEITRGCPYNCAFCQTSQIFGTKLRHRDIQNICESVEIMASKGLYDTRFITPSLFLYGSQNGKNLNLTKLEELFKNVSKIIKPKGKLFLGTFPSELRPEHITQDTVELLKKYADNDNVIVGVQSGSDRILNLTNRQHTISDVYKAVELLTKANFKVNLDFIFGLPYEEDTDIQQTIKVIEELTNRYKVYIHPHIFTPLPSTKFQNLEISINIKYLNLINHLKNKNLIYKKS
ncbi:MAG: TIGR04013 family B12-binding domain/radical SAM domain-containing protein [Endomicrobiia bacterium]